MSRSRALTLITAVTILALVGSPALAKGPSSATVTGPGIEEPIELFSYWTGDPETRDLVTRLMAGTGIWYGNHQLERTSEPLQLGEPYRLTWTLGGPDTIIQQFLYFNTQGAPLIHTPEQPGLEGWGGEPTGWYVAPPELIDTLVALGVPIEAGTAASITPVVMPAVVLAVAVLLSISLNRRRPLVVSLG